MKSLAEVFGLNNTPNQKVVTNYSFNIAPDARAIQSDIFSGKEPEKLVKTTQFWQQFVSDPKL
jgi:hypothetical protein